MADKFANMPPKILQCFVVAFTPTSTDGERVNALRAIDVYLMGADSDQRDVVARIKAPPQSLNKAEMDAIFEAGRIKGRADEVELRQRASTAIALHVSADISNGFAGYSWEEIAGHCLANLQRIPSNHHSFVEGMADRLSEGRELTKPQAEYLRNLFQRHFNSTIT